MNQEPCISVIVPVYNVEKLLDRCLASIVNQTYRNLEILLVDDGSTDGSGRICDDYARKDERIRVLHKANGGQSSARNMALDVAKGEYIAFVDSDDWIEPNALEEMVSRVLQYDVKLVSAGRYDVDGGTGERTLGLCPRKEEVISSTEMLGRLFSWDQCDSAPWDKLFHRSLFADIRFPLNVIYEDVAIVYQLVEKAGRVCMLDLPVYNYFHRPNSTTTQPLSARKFLLEQHAEKIYGYIRQTYPEIEPQARYFWIRSLVHSVLTVELAEKSARKEFRDQRNHSRRLLRKQTAFLMTSPLFGRRERLTDLTLAYGLYPALRKLYHAVK